jgi:uncharacterized protein
MKPPLTLLLSLTFLFWFSGSSVVFADDWQDGGDAFERKDYKTAYKLWLPLAERGKRMAQYFMGLMNEEGLGIPQHYKEAVKWYRLSAKQDGGSRAQYQLGVMYSKGLGVLRDYEEAHMWLNLSASNGDSRGVSDRDKLEKKMSPEQIEKAQEMARNWILTYN